MLYLGGVATSSWPAQLQQRLDDAQTEPDRVTALLTLVEWLAEADPWRAKPRATEAVAAATRLDDEIALARAHCGLARSLLYTLGPRDAFDEVMLARALYVAHDHTLGMAWCDHVTGLVLEFLGDPGGATVHLERALAAFRTVGDVNGEVRALTALGAGELACDRHQQALELLRVASAAAERHNDPVGLNTALLQESLALATLGVRTGELGDEDGARVKLAKALSDCQRVYERAVAVGDASNEPLALAAQVEPLTYLGDARAVEVAERALARAGELRLDHHLAFALQAAGSAHVATGALRKGIGLLRRSLALYGQWDLSHDTVTVLRVLVDAYEAEGDIAAALGAHKQLLAVQLRLKDKIAERDDQVAAARMEMERITGADDRFRLAQLARKNRRLSDEAMAMERLAHTDALTGLANRRHCDAQLGRSLVQAELTEAPLSVIIIDVDHFKRINDAFSHVVGDEVLRVVARELARHCRVSDLPCRTGGEEFTVLLPATVASDAARVAERLRISVAELDLSHIAPNLHVTLSAGVADARGGDAVSLLAMADKSLYGAKAAGRNRVHVAGGTIT